MSRVEALRRILKADALEMVQEQSVVLKERNTSGGEAPQEVMVLASSTEVVAVRMDKFSHSSMLQGSRWKVCDYVLFVEQADREDVVVIELKKNRANDSSSREQLRQSVPIVEYLAAAAGIEASPEDDPAKAEPMNVHYVILYGRDGPLLDKQATHVASVAATGRELYRGMNIRWRIGRHTVLSDLLSDEEYGALAAQTAARKSRQ